MSNISVGGGIYNLSVPLKNAITTLKQRQEQASDALALQGFSGTDAKTQAMIAELSAQITALEKQLAMVNQNIRKVLAMKENGAIELKDGLFASFAQQNGEQGSQELGSLIKASAQNIANVKSGGDEMAGDEVSAGMSFDSGVNELAGLVELDPSKLPEGDTKQQKLAKLTAMKTAIEEKIVALQSKIADLMAPSLNVLA